MENPFIRLQMALGEDALEKLKNSHVAVFGIGGVGSYTAEALARAGVGAITLVDNDTVGVSNLNRQLCALHSTLGRFKAEAMAEIQTIAKEMSQESNIESILMSKGFTQCLAVINGDSANIVVRTEGQLQSSQLAQINAVVYEQAGIEPVNITIVAKS